VDVVQPAGVQPAGQPKKPGWWARKSKGKKFLWIGGGIVVLVIVIAVAASAGGGDGSTSTTVPVAAVTTQSSTATTAAATTTTTAGATTTTASPATTTTAATTTTSSTEATTTTAAVQTYSSGTYQVGTDLPAGLYKGMTDGEGGYWEITKDASGSLDSIIANANVSGQFYVDVKAAQFLTLNELIIADANAVKTETPVSTDISDGMYLVGTDIVAGRYKGTTNGDSGYWQVTKDASGTMDSIISNDNVSGQFYVDVKAGQYLTLNGLTISISK
jgi:hypothetical protein